MKRKKIFLSKYILPLLCIIAILGLYLLLNRPIKVTYTSENLLKEKDNNNLVGLEYNYYLDISPSMLGYFDAEENTMSLLANVFEKINVYDNNFYLCSDEIINRSADDFYNYMKFSEGIDEIWRNLLIDKKLDKASKKCNLNMIFSQEIDNLNNIINIIITDMNFGTKDYTKEERKENMEKFANSLVEENKTSNLCIYNFDSSYSGEVNSDTYKSDWKERVNENADGSFFVILFTESKKAYDSFINDLENSLKEVQLDIFKKIELKNHVFEDKHEIFIDQKKFVNLNNTELNNFNFDSKTFKNLPNNAVGLRFYGEKENIASIRMDVSEYDLAIDYSNIKDGEKLNCIIEPEVKVCYPSPLNFSYSEYINENKVVNQENAFMERKNEKNILVYEMNVQKNEEFPHFPFTPRYFIIDISFMMKNPGYIVPEWVSSLNIARQKETYIEEFFQILIKNKNEGYENFVSEYERYMGSLYVFINY